MSHAECGLRVVVGAKEVWPAGTVSSFSPQKLQSRIVEIRSEILQSSNVVEGNPKVAISVEVVKNRLNVRLPEIPPPVSLGVVNVAFR